MVSNRNLTQRLRRPTVCVLRASGGLGRRSGVPLALILHVVLPWLRCTCVCACCSVCTYMGAPQHLLGRARCLYSARTAIYYVRPDYTVSQYQRIGPDLDRLSAQLAQPCSHKPFPMTARHPAQPTNPSRQEKGPPSPNQQEHRL